MRKIPSLNLQIPSAHLRRELILAGALSAILVVAGIVLHASKGALVSEAMAPQTQAVATQHVRFTLYPEGIYPTTATVRKGLISIAIEDLAGANGGVLIERLDDRDQQTVGRVERSPRHFRGRSSVNLTPGTYRLRVAGKPTKDAQLTVEP